MPSLASHPLFGLTHPLDQFQDGAINQDELKRMETEVQKLTDEAVRRAVTVTCWANAIGVVASCSSEAVR